MELAYISEDRLTAKYLMEGNGYFVIVEVRKDNNVGWRIANIKTKWDYSENRIESRFSYSQKGRIKEIDISDSDENGRIVLCIARSEIGNIQSYNAENKTSIYTHKGDYLDDKYFSAQTGRTYPIENGEFKLPYEVAKNSTECILVKPELPKMYIDTAEKLAKLLNRRKTLPEDVDFQL